MFGFPKRLSDKLVAVCRERLPATSVRISYAENNLLTAISISLGLIEDTDSERSVQNGIEGIIKDLANFDIIPDEGVIGENEEKHCDEIRQIFVDALFVDGFARDVVSDIHYEHLKQRLQTFRGFLAAFAIGFGDEIEQND